MNTPYDTGKVKIGCNYQPPLINMYNPDQDWVQEWLLGIEQNWYEKTDNLIQYALFILAIYAICNLLARP
jgi:hypothetical protein